MPDASPFYAIRNLALDAITWTPVTTPIACNGFSIRCPVDIKIRTDKDDPTTEDTIYGQNQEYIMEFWHTTGCRFPSGATIAYLQSESGTPTAIVKFVL